MIKQALLFIAVLLILLSVFWGVLGPKWRICTAIGLITWGFGDSAAAIIGKRYGKRNYRFSLFDPEKTLCGTFTMIAVSSACLFVFLLFTVKKPIILLFLISLGLGSAAGLTEAVTKNGLDTITVPLATAVISLLLIRLISPEGIPF